VVEDRENTATYADDLAEVAKMGSLSVKEIPMRKVITSFSGLRAHEEGGDFVIGEASGAPGFFDAAGIESPGLSCSPAIGEEVAKMVAQAAGASEKKDFIATRKGVLRTRDMDPQERTKLIKEHPEYGTIVCRCEQVSEGEIIDAITRAGCGQHGWHQTEDQSGDGPVPGRFCTPRTMELLCEKRKMRMESVCKNQKGSELLRGDHDERA
jgi:glycerol-3-phosphate dehydrogenase